MSGSGGDKTEKATPKKRRDARERGQVLHSSEANIAFCCVAMFGLLLLIWPSFTDDLAEMYGQYLNADAILPMADSFTTNVLMGTFSKVVTTMLTLLLPIFAVAMIAGALINLLQVGFLFTTKTLSPKMERISPLKGFKRIFSARTFIELLKSLLKVIVLGYVLYTEYKKLLDKVPGLMGLNLYSAFLEIMNIAFSLALKMSLVLVVIAAADYLFQWWRYEKDLRMTKQEVKDEYKLTEGGPQIKGKIRQKQRQMSAMRMMGRVPDADVVITNPTHYAIALRYDDKQDEAPVVIAKGQDYIARKIKEVARENKIQVIENKPLAQSLYAMCEIDTAIPAEFYQAVADILVLVYKQKRGGR